MWNIKKYSVMAIVGAGLAVAAATSASACGAFGYAPIYGAAYGGCGGYYGYAAPVAYGWGGGCGSYGYAPISYGCGSYGYGGGYYGAAYGCGGGYYGAAYGYAPVYRYVPRVYGYGYGYGCGHVSHRSRGYGYALAWHRPLRSLYAAHRFMGHSYAQVARAHHRLASVLRHTRHA
jgi:hypothetical protein